MQASRASHPGIYAFDAADAALSLLPMAARRALDAAGLHLSLASWQQLTLPERQALVQLGAAESVDPKSVQACLAGVGARAEEPRLDPSATLPPAELVEALGATRPLVAARWSELHPLDRYVLAKLAGRGRLERLALAYDEITAAYSGGA